MAAMEVLLRKLFNQIAKAERYDDYILKFKPISGDGSNYTSILYIATISSSGKEDLQLFAKAAALSKKCRDEVPSHIFEMEQFFYTDLVVKYKVIEDKYGIPEEEGLVLPKLYGYNSTLYEEILVLENLSAKGFTMHDRLQSISWDYAASAVEVLAKFHATSIAYSEEYPEQFKALYDKCNQNIGPFHASLFTKFRKFIDLALAETKEENRDKLAKFVELKENLSFTSRTKNRRRSVLAHGDFKPSNLMHRVNEVSIYIFP